jgi:hypothetical protein
VEFLFSLTGDDASASVFDLIEYSYNPRRRNEPHRACRRRMGDAPRRNGLRDPLA